MFNTRTTNWIVSGGSWQREYDGMDNMSLLWMKQGERWLTIAWHTSEAACRQSNSNAHQRDSHVDAHSASGAHESHRFRTKPWTPSHTAPHPHSHSPERSVGGVHGIPSLVPPKQAHYRHYSHSCAFFACAHRIQEPAAWIRFATTPLSLSPESSVVGADSWRLQIASGPAFSVELSRIKYCIYCHPNVGNILYNIVNPIEHS